ncbi:SH3 domain-containing protein [Streptomyces sp. NPDC053253]|uniref:SH3 domain-containing protein n=1 Tax=Streptomyces sp. NPDC053253 TaxID=3365699 RepID=UPI0037D01E5C
MRQMMITGAVLLSFTAPAAAALPAAAAPAAVTQEFNSCGYHPKTTIHLRTGPSSRHASLGLLGPHDSIQAYEERGGWYRVELEGDAKSGLRAGRSGWVAKKNVEPAVCMRLN